MADAATPDKDGPPGHRLTGVRWERIHVWYQRLLGLGWLALGLQSWATIIGVSALNARPFEGRGLTAQAMIIYFAVVDVMAAVGLWLLAPWGGVLWLIACVSRIVLAVLFPAVAGLGAIGLVMLGLCLILYLALTVLVARQSPQ